MDLPILTAAAIGLAVLSITGGDKASMQSASTSSKAEGPAALVGQTLYGTEDPIDRWGDPVRAEDLALEGLGQIAQVVTTPEGEAQGLVVAVGGLWGFGAQEVELGLERVHLLRAADGREQLVVDLSNSGAEPPTES